MHYADSVIYNVTLKKRFVQAPPAIAGFRKIDKAGKAV